MIIVCRWSNFLSSWFWEVFLYVLKFPYNVVDDRMFNIFTLVPQSADGHIYQVWKFLPDYYISTILFFKKFCCTDFELSQLFLLLSLVPIFYLFISLWLMMPISLAVSSSILIQHCSNIRRSISMANLYTHHWKFLVSHHIWFPVHRNRSLWKVDSSVHSHGGSAKFGKCFRGNWDSVEGATQWKRALSKTNVKFPLICNK